MSSEDYVDESWTPRHNALATVMVGWLEGRVTS